MSCISALHTQLVTFISVPHEILLFRHRVFKEYAKTAVGPDFVHTLPSLIILAAMVIYLWGSPPKIRTVTGIRRGSIAFRSLQILASWVVINGFLWLWLIGQRVLYCFIWSHWSSASEFRDDVSPWWQRVWSSYYPPPLQPPLLSASLVSWIISMITSIGIFGCATTKTKLQELPSTDTCFRWRDLLGTATRCFGWSSNRFQDPVSTENRFGQDDSEISSICEECRSDFSAEVTREKSRRSGRSMSYAAGWTPRASFSGFKEAPRRYRDKSGRGCNTVTGSTIHRRDADDDEGNLSPRQLRHRRGCHTVVPSNSSEKSSGC